MAVAQVDMWYQTQLIADFVGQILQQFLGMLQVDHFAIVIFADVDPPTLRIGKPANPFQIFILPGLLPLDALRFFSRRNTPFLTTKNTKRAGTTCQRQMLKDNNPALQWC